LIHNQPFSLILHNHRAPSSIHQSSIHQSSIHQSSILIPPQCLPAAESNGREKFKGRLHDNIPDGARIAFLVAAIVLPILRPAVSASPKAGAETLKQLEARFINAAADKGSQGTMSYDADESVELPNGGPMIQGKTNIAKGMSFFEDNNNRLIWTPVWGGDSLLGRFRLYL
jgi:hypothetical protein